MKKIGIRFELMQTFDTKCLFEILKYLKEKNFFWYIVESQTEVWADKNGKEAFGKQKYNTQEFYEVISCNHYAVFLKIQAYLKQNSFYEIHTKKEFEESDCQMLLLICDSFWCDIYTKEYLIDFIYRFIMLKQN